MEKKYEMLISIIVPVYNAEKYLEQCLDSLVAQTYQCIEIILINDGSIDGSGLICEKYSKKYPQIVVYEQINAGAYSAIINGITNAKGNFLAFVDSDDYVAETYIENMARCLDYGVEMVSMNATRDFDGELSIYKTNTLKEGCYNTSDYYDRLINDCGSYEKVVSNSRWGKLFSRNIVSQAMQYFNKNLYYGEDQQFTLACLMFSQKFYIVDVYDYYYRYNNASIVNTYKAGLWHNILELIASLKNVPFAQKINNLNEQTNTMLIIYANDVLKKELTFNKSHNKEKILEVINESSLISAFDNYNSEKMGRYDKLMSKAVSSRSLIRVKNVYKIYKLYCKITKQTL